MGGSLTMKVPVGTTNLAGVMCETELVFKLSGEGPILQAMSETEGCDCLYCSGSNRPKNVSPLAAIDLYSLPDETDASACLKTPSN